LYPISLILAISSAALGNETAEWPEKGGAGGVVETMDRLRCRLRCC
jgi:hypothetical protein